MNWEIFQFAFAKKTGGVRFLMVGIDLDTDDLEEFESQIENLGDRLTLLARFSSCESAKSYNTTVEFVTFDEFRSILKVSRQSSNLVIVGATMTNSDRERFVSTLCALGFDRSDVQEYAKGISDEEWRGPARPRVQSAIRALSA